MTTLRAKAYPNMLVTSGPHDSPGSVLGTGKMVAKLRKLKTDDNLLLLYTDMEAGHGAVSQDGSTICGMWRSVMCSC